MIRADAGKTIINNYIVNQSEVGAYMWSASYSDSQRTFDWNVSKANEYMNDAYILLRDFGK